MKPGDILIFDGDEPKPPCTHPGMPRAMFEFGKWWFRCVSCGQPVSAGIAFEAFLQRANELRGEASSMEALAGIATRESAKAKHD